MAPRSPSGVDDMASRSQALAKKPDTVAESQRQCGVCKIKLSSYNPGPDCWQHTIDKPWQGPTAKPRA
jgi:hypothetical protein